MDVLANSIYSGPITSAFNVERFDENPFTCHCEKGEKRRKKEEEKDLKVSNIALLLVVFK